MTHLTTQKIIPAAGTYTSHSESSESRWSTRASQEK